MKSSQRAEKGTEGRGGYARWRGWWIAGRGETTPHISFLFGKLFSFWGQTRLVGMAPGEEWEMKCKQDKMPAAWSRGERREAEERKIGLVPNGAQGPHVHFRGTELLRLISEEVSHWRSGYTLSKFILPSSYVITASDAQSSKTRMQKDSALESTQTFIGY